MATLGLMPALHAFLVGESAVTDLVSTRIYRQKRPMNTSAPAIVYRKISGQDVTHQSAATTLAEARVEFECFGSTPAAAEAIRDALRDVLQVYSGTITSGSDSLVIVRATIEDDGELFERPADASDAGDFSATVDLHVWYRPDAPTG